MLVTIDGVRWQEIFDGTDPSLSSQPRMSARNLLPNLYALGSERGAFLGAPGFGEIAASGPEHVSLPGYNEIFGGRAPHHCRDNNCPRTPVPTLLDDLATSGARVAAFASWAKLDLALTSHPGNFPVSCGPSADGSDRLPGTLDSRTDHATATAALAYLEAETPDALFLGLGEPDEHAHHGSYEAYIAALQAADAIVGRIVGILDRDERGRRGHIVVLPDHGRGRDWRHHGGVAPEAARVWMVAAGPRIAARGYAPSSTKRHLANVAPTLRVLLGGGPASKENGNALGELFEPPL